MKRMPFIILISIFIFGLLPVVVSAEIEADHESVRRMLTAPDNQFFDMWETDSLIEVLVDIISNDPADAPYHERVVSSALKVLGSMNVPEAVPLLIDNLDEYTTICLYWLGTYAEPDTISAIVEYLDDESPSVRCEAATALGTVPVSESTSGTVEDEKVSDQISIALEAINGQLEVETDTDVIDALTSALEHLS